MKALIDTNVVLDVILGREPWVGEAVALLTAVDAGRIEGYIAGHTVTTVHYIVAKARDRKVAAAAVADLLRVLHVVPLHDADFHQALVLGLPDFEDSVQASAALNIGADFIITRNPKDFKGVSVAVNSPGEILALL